MADRFLSLFITSSFIAPASSSEDKKDMYQQCVCFLLRCGSPVCNMFTQFRSYDIFFIQFLDWQNDLDGLLAFECGDNGYINGMKSYHDNNAEDRRWGFHCCEMGGKYYF